MRNSKTMYMIVALGALVFAAAPTLAGELVINGGLETGSFGSAWQHGAFLGGNTNPNLADHVVLQDLPWAGNYSALLGFKYTTQTTDARGWMSQDVTIPTGISSAVLNFKVRMQGYDSDPWDPFIMEIRNGGGGTLANVLTYTFTEYNDKFKDSGWLSDDNVAPAGYDMSGFAGQTVTLYFEQSNLFDNLYETWTYVDDVSLVFRMWLDLAVDGNGNDVFGTPGSGAGGTSTASGVAGDTLYYTVTVENEGTVADTYQLGATAPPGWSVLIDTGSGVQALPWTTPSLPAGTSVDYTVMVVSPGAAAGGTYNVVLDAVSITQGSRNDSATLQALVVDAVYLTDLVVDGNGVGVIADGGGGGFSLKQAPWDSTVTYALEVFNTGNSPTAFDIDLQIAPGAIVSIDYNATNYTAPFVTAVIPDGGSALMTLNAQVPSPLPGGDYETIVRALAANDTLRRDTIRAVLRLRAPRVDMIIATSGNGVYDDTYSGLGGASSNAGERNAVVHFPVILQNESVVPDAFTLDWVVPGGGWTAVIEIGGVDQAFPVVTPTIAGQSQASYVLKVTIPGGAAFGTHTSILNATSETNGNISESVSAVISVAEPSEIDVTINGQGVNVYGPLGTGLGGTWEQTVNPGDTATFDIVIENILGTNSFESFWATPSGWQVTLSGNPSPQSGIPAGAYTLEVVVPTTSLGGTFDIILDTHKTDKPFFMDSVTGRVIVVPPAVVDALIDGNGNEIFGAPGTGGGGASTQLTAPPNTLNYTVEIQNQGPAADQYQVTWNPIPLWTATFAGSASPFTTSPIAASASAIYTFTVNLPAGVSPASYAYTIDVISLSDSTSYESITAGIDVVGPPRADLAIDGNGIGVFGPMGSGQGGRSVVGAGPGTAYTSTLRVQNAGSFADSFRVQWSLPAGWPAGSVSIIDGGTTYTLPFWSVVLQPGQFHDYDVSVTVPPALTGSHTTIIDAWSSLPPNATESVALVTETMAWLRGVVFDDRDHDLVFGPGDVGLVGVTVTETSSGLTAVTGSGGAYLIAMPAGSPQVIEHNPAGWISLTPDTLGPFVVSAGDTIVADFADVAPLYISTGGVRNAISGSYVDFPHTVEAGTAGQVALTASNGVGAVTMFMFDENGNGVFDGNDRALQPADLLLDPTVNNGTVAVLLRVFIPTALQVGTQFHVTIDAVQNISGTALTASAGAVDAVLVTGSALGRISLSKAADLSDAAPGDVLTYSVTFFNAGTDSVQNLVLLDPISPWVDLEPDGFGPGQDLEWQPSGQPATYLTFNPADADECEYSATERLLRLFLSKNGPFYVAPGETGNLSYRVRVR